jgi:hypothetical protein
MSILVVLRLPRSDQLRYLATNDIKPLVAVRRETSEAEYAAFMRERVGPKDD